jgi:hypothetical protein
MQELCGGFVYIISGEAPLSSASNAQAASNGTPLKMTRKTGI